jgi:hypothetical protein
VVSSVAASSSLDSASPASSSAAGSSSLDAEAEALLDPLSLLLESLSPHAVANNDSTASKDSTFIHRFNIFFPLDPSVAVGVSREH